MESKEYSSLSGRSKNILERFLLKNFPDDITLVSVTKEALANNITPEKLRKTFGCGEKTLKEIYMWLNGEPPIPQIKHKSKKFRIFGKIIRITISIN
jgi:hypothetical protein